MPELPEVETVRRTLEGKLTGCRIAAVEVNLAKMVKGWKPGDFIKDLRGQTLVQVGRRGKYLLFDLSAGKTLVVHLGMSGKLVCCPKELPRPIHTHVVWSLDEDAELRYTDPRQFGSVHLVPAGKWDTIPGLAAMGPEPLEEFFTPALLAERLKGKKGKLKGVLLDQRVIAGLGNIYADEALFRASLHPLREAGSLEVREITFLANSIQEVLQEGLKHGGTSISDYVDGEGNKGRNQDYLRVYGRGGAPCMQCGTSLQSIKVAGRTTTYCPHCQK